MAPLGTNLPPNTHRFLWPRIPDFWDIRSGQIVRGPVLPSHAHAPQTPNHSQALDRASSRAKLVPERESSSYPHKARVLLKKLGELKAQYAHNMAELSVGFDLVKIYASLRYAQDSLDCLARSEADGSLDRGLPAFSPDLLDQTMALGDALSQDRSLHRLHNFIAPINRLPSEVFGHIFSYLKDDPMPSPVSREYSDGRSSRTTGSWHRPGLVCRRWRKDVLNTPGLWTVIKVSDDPDATTQWATTWLSRSGALPLSIIFNTQFKHKNGTNVLSRILEEGHRIREVYFYQIVSTIDLTRVLTQVADHLEILHLRGDESHWRIRPHLNRFSYVLPRLRVLSIVDSLIWRAFSMGNLQHLSLVSWSRAKWEVEDLRSFHFVLAGNPNMEEIVLYGVAVRLEGAHELHTLTGHPLPIPMPQLQRLFTRHPLHNPSIRAMDDILSDTLTLSPACTRFYVPAGPSLHAPYPVQRLAIVHGSLVGTDGTSACVMQRDRESGQRLHIDCEQVQELWLRWSTSRQPVYIPRTGDRDPDNTHDLAIISIWNMHNVVLLTIEFDLSFWLEHLENSFPSLRELQILMHRYDDREAILQFLAQRKHIGLTVHTLRFVGDPTSDSSEAFSAWKADPWEFRRYTEQVIFEEESSNPDLVALWVDFISEKMPKACKHPSPTGKVWQPWFRYIMS